MDIKITPSWQALSSLSGISSGTQIKIQNKGSYPFYLLEGAVQPPESSTEGEVVTPLDWTEPSKIITAGSSEIWVRTSYPYVSTAFVQDIS